jgi:hypothetical protein
LLGPLPPAQGN